MRCNNKVKKYFEGLQGLRGLAALGIIAYHMYVLEGYTGTNSILDKTVGMGGLFVQLFFMLSSFSLMCGYAEAFWTGTLDYENFYKRRFAKLAPTFYFSLCLHLLLNWAVGIKESFANILGTASFLYALMPSHQESIVMAGWALGIEIIFYLIFPFFLVVTKSKLRTILFLVAGIALQYSYIMYYGVDIELSHINIVYQLPPFIWGAVLFHIVPYMERICERCRRNIGIGIQIILLIILVVWVEFSTNKFTVYITFSLLILNQINYKDFWINNPLLIKLGKISYEMYLLHMVVYRILYYYHVNEMLHTKIGSELLSYCFLFLLVTILTAGISYCFLFFSRYLRQLSIACHNILGK